MGSSFFCSFCGKKFYVDRFVLVDANNNYYCPECREKSFAPYKERYKRFISGLKKRKKEEKK